MKIFNIKVNSITKSCFKIGHVHNSCPLVISIFVSLKMQMFITPKSALHKEQILQKMQVTYNYLFTLQYKFVSYGVVSSTLFSCRGKNNFCCTYKKEFHNQNENFDTQSGGFRRGLVLCLQVEKNSLLSFSVDPSGLNIMKNFSLRHRLQRLVEGLKL